MPKEGSKPPKKAEGSQGKRESDSKTQSQEGQETEARSLPEHQGGRTGWRTYSREFSRCLGSKTLEDNPRKPRVPTQSGLWTLIVRDRNHNPSCHVSIMPSALITQVSLCHSAQAHRQKHVGQGGTMMPNQADILSLHHFTDPNHHLTPLHPHTPEPFHSPNG